ncbi:MAG TPA: hypothetical protein VJN18_18110 [Polyangiaceae bacterium]|nr:hypothetical protein [Polyangiaceae bacterium]
MLTKRHAAELGRRLTPGQRSGGALSVAGDVLLHSDAIVGAGELARVSADAATTALSDASVTSVVDVAAAAGEGAAELAGGAIEVLLSVFDVF